MKLEKFKKKKVMTFIVAVASVESPQAAIVTTGWFKQKRTAFHSSGASCSRARMCWLGLGRARLICRPPAPCSGLTWPFACILAGRETYFSFFFFE